MEVAFWSECHLKALRSADRTDTQFTSQQQAWIDEQLARHDWKLGPPADDDRLAQLNYRTVEHLLRGLADARGVVAPRDKVDQSALAHLQSSEGMLEEYLRFGTADERKRPGPGAYDCWLEERFVDEYLDMLSGCVERWKQLRVALVARPLAPHAAQYFAEASRAYIFGFFRATILLCRTTLEEALRVRLRECGQAAAPEVHLIDLIRLAAVPNLRLLKSKNGSLSAAHRVRTAGNDVAHPNTSVDQKQARDCLNALDQVLQHVFA